MSNVSNTTTAFPPSLKAGDVSLIGTPADETVFGRYPPSILNVTINASGVEERKIVHTWNPDQNLRMVRYDLPGTKLVWMKLPPTMDCNDTQVFNPGESLAWFDLKGKGHRIDPFSGTDHLEVDPGHIKATIDDPNNKGKFIVDYIAVSPTLTVTAAPTALRRKSFYEPEMPTTIVNVPLSLETGSECSYQSGFYKPSGGAVDSQVGDLRPRSTFTQIP